MLTAKVCSRPIDMEETRDFLSKLGLPRGDLPDLPASPKRFPDEAQYRIEIPSVESPEQFSRVIDKGKELEVPIHRVSQGSGVMLLSDKEIEEMVELGKAERMEVSLFTGPRAVYDTGGSVKAPMGNTMVYRIRGTEQLVHAVEDIKRGIHLGIRSFLISDEGLLWVISEMRQQGEIPTEVVFKVSVSAGHGNPASALLLQRLGASTFNIVTDLSLSQLAAVRNAIDIPLDIYVTVPSGYGGFIRHYEAPDMVRVASPTYLKFGIPLGQNVYPAGRHLLNMLLGYADEEVRQAKICYSLIRKAYPDAMVSEKGAKGLAVPV